MRANEDRFRFLEANRLSITWHRDGVSIFWRGPDRPGQPGQYRNISSGKSLTDATDKAIARWERKHGRRFGAADG